MEPIPTRYIKDRWLNKKYERIALSYKGQWIYYNVGDSKKKEEKMKLKTERTIEEVEQCIDRSKKEQAALEKERDALLLHQRKAFQCVRCLRISPYEQQTSAQKKEKLCDRCWHAYQISVRRQELQNLVSGIITDVEYEPWHDTGLRSLTVYKQHMLYELRVVVQGECTGDATLEIIDRNKAKNEPVIDQEIRPWQKKRSEIKLNLPGQRGDDGETCL